MDSTPDLSWLLERWVLMFAIAWVCVNSPGFHVVLEDGEDISIFLRDNRRDMFQCTPQGDQQVKLE